MKIIYGDLITYALAGKFTCIIHGCNCFCTMRAGVANAIRISFKDAELADRETKIGDKSKLGGISYVEVSIGLPNPLIIVNAYTQFNYGRSEERYVNYDAVRSVMKLVKRKFSGLRIAYPKIGAGLGGGDWKIIETIINEELDGEDHTLVIYE